MTTLFNQSLTLCFIFRNEDARDPEENISELTFSVAWTIA